MFLFEAGYPRTADGLITGKNPTPAGFPS